jgi:hypothetical protein
MYHQGVFTEFWLTYQMRAPNCHQDEQSLITGLYTCLRIWFNISSEMSIKWLGSRSETAATRERQFQHIAIQSVHNIELNVTGIPVA